MSINPFDIKSALLAKHAQHVVLIHFPIALFLRGRGVRLSGAVEEEPARWLRRRISICSSQRSRPCRWWRPGLRRGNGRSRDKS